jgi:hypothetical protein
MAFSTQTLRLLKWLYWIGLSAVQLYVVYLLFANDRAITGTLWLIFGFMLIYIMYPVYFPPGDPGSHWPPYIAACPDYLTMVQPGYCADYVGLYSTRLQKSDPKNPPAITDTAKVFNAQGSTSQKAANATAYGLTWEGVN